MLRGKGWLFYIWGQRYYSHYPLGGGSPVDGERDGLTVPHLDDHLRALPHRDCGAGDPSVHCAGTMENCPRQHWHLSAPSQKERLHVAYPWKSALLVQPGVHQEYTGRAPLGPRGALPVYRNGIGWPKACWSGAPQARGAPSGAPGGSGLPSRCTGRASSSCMVHQLGTSLDSIPGGACSARTRALQNRQAPQ